MPKPTRAFFVPVLPRVHDLLLASAALLGSFACSSTPAEPRSSPTNANHVARATPVVSPSNSPPPERTPPRPTVAKIIPSRSSVRAAPVPTDVHTRWEPSVQSLAAVPGDANLEIGTGLSSKDLLEAMLQSHAAGFDMFRLSGAAGNFSVFPTARAVPASGELVLVLRSHAWTGYLIPDLGPPLEEVSGPVTTLENDILRAVHAWGGPPCQAVVIPTADIPVARVMEMMAALQARKSNCTIDFTLLPLREPFAPDGIPRFSRAPSRTLYLRTNSTLPARAAASENSSSHASRPITLREERRVIVDGVAESWRIVWRGPTEPVCAPQEDFSCPCRAYRYGELGVAELIRSRPGHPDEFLLLGRLFANGGDELRSSPDQAVLRRWPVYEDDYKEEDRLALARRVHNRPPTTLMVLRDYNHDGWSTEFELPVDVTGCVDVRSVIVGVTRKHNRLHAFSSVETPGSPLLLQPMAWQALLRSPHPHVVTAVELECGFRGADRQVEVELKPTEEHFFATRVEYGCPKGPPRARSVF